MDSGPFHESSHPCHQDMTGWQEKGRADGHNQAIVSFVAVQLLHFGMEVPELTAATPCSNILHTLPPQALLPACLLPHREGRAETRMVVPCVDSIFNRAVTHGHVDPWIKNTLPASALCYRRFCQVTQPQVWLKDWATLKVTLKLFLWGCVHNEAFVKHWEFWNALKSFGPATARN